MLKATTKTTDIIRGGITNSNSKGRKSVTATSETLIKWRAQPPHWPESTLEPPEQPGHTGSLKPLLEPQNLPEPARNRRHVEIRDHWNWRAATQARYAGQFQMFLIMFQNHVNFCSRSTLQNTTDSRCYSHVRKHRIQFVSVCFLNLIIRWIHNSLGAEPPEGSLRDLHQASPASPSSSASQVWELGNPKKLFSVDLNFWCAGDCWNHVVCEEHPAHWPSIAPHAESPLVWKPRDQLTSSSSGKHSERQVVPEVRRPLGLVCEASTVQPVPGPSSLSGSIPVGSSWHSVSIFLLIFMNLQVTYGFSKVRQLWQHVDIRCIVDRYMI